MKGIDNYPVTQKKKKKACPPADSTPGKPALAADSSPKAWYPESWGVNLSPSPVALAGLKPDLSSGPARVGIQVDSRHASQPSQQGSSQLRPTRLTASLDGPLKGSQTALVTAAATATNSATAPSAATPAGSIRQSCQQ